MPLPAFYGVARAAARLPLEFLHWARTRNGDWARTTLARYAFGEPGFHSIK
jgi:hypothetical protein